MRILTTIALLALPVLAHCQEYKVVATPEQVLAEVNALRAQKGLPAYVLDPKLAEGATACAIHRAQRGISGHTSNDFAFLPAGTRASAAGCAAWPVSMGWGSCCCYDRYTYAGAGFCVGPDGKRYMHLFVR